MFWTIACVLFLSSGLALSQTANTTADVRDAFSQSRIVPDVLPSFNPVAILGVVFADNSTTQALNVTPGMNLTMALTAMKPEFFLNTTNATLSNQTFVLAIVDPDAPSPQNTSISQFRHFLGGGFHINGVGNESILTNTTAALSDFFPPTPPAGSDPHRYVILLYNEPPTFEDDARALVNASSDRQHFNLTTFAAAVHLGDPIAGNFFLTGPDSSPSGTASGSQPSSATPSTGSNGARRTHRNSLLILLAIALSSFLI